MDCTLNILNCDKTLGFLSYVSIGIFAFIGNQPGQIQAGNSANLLWVIVSMSDLFCKPLQLLRSFPGVCHWVVSLEPGVGVAQPQLFLEGFCALPKVRPHRHLNVGLLSRDPPFLPSP